MITLYALFFLKMSKYEKNKKHNINDETKKNLIYIYIYIYINQIYIYIIYICILCISVDIYIPTGTCFIFPRTHQCGSG